MKKITKNTLIKDCGFSVRAHNVLYTNSEKMGVSCTTSDISPLKLGDLSKISISDLKFFRQCGPKTVAEITNLAERAGVKFKKMAPSNKPLSPEKISMAYETIGEFMVHFEHLSFSVKQKISMIWGAWGAMDALVEPYAFRQSVKVLKNLIDAKTKDWDQNHPDIKLYRKLIKDLNILNNDRNALLHSAWFMSLPGDKSEKITLTTFGREKNGEFTLDYVQGMVSKCKSLNQLIWKVWSVDNRGLSHELILSDIFERTQGLWVLKNKKQK